MRVISVIGITDSGKTTTIENIIKELKRRGYTVGTVKEVHFHNFKMDVEGTNTDRHRKAGAQLVTARGEYETDILYQEKLSIHKILSFYTQDFVILEGVRDTSVPKILTAHDIKGIEDRLDETVFAISGRISAQTAQYKGLPAINAMTDVEKLVDLIEERACGFFPDRKEACFKVTVNKREISVSLSAQKLLDSAVEALLGELDGYWENGEIEICIRK
ncbi:molybdopterin-guanine dinucleotide biosynthesis protein B [Geosporobacter ferrireducens]|uniref:Molybdopterin-guanine dinucleotide biosynthesis protein B n=1 Tax=Geosporobacter ferrireducens TaxID=1424294 RepID=A0A1D8GF88_9FIRM|nr:molybdopterin-guanine dinucleotide biosynthesis protein B [Geosporobacter ferrireducens]AOT69552.1 molybdopterin-guanine dinucleotide biosynthesis protein B [Geosporobacter ferrireducens]MTI54754.1 molybdopterin-guanine dinucleotide biosynthesis protein B [Geosporobacter ferrireducens]